ncbi:MAG: hypothetical protein ACOCRO_08265 [Halanaerobiales bacterium]
MNFRGSTTLFIAILTYSLTILIGLIQGQSLSNIFINGTKVLIVTVILVIFIFILIDFLSKNKSGDINNSSNDINNRSNDSKIKENYLQEEEKDQNSNKINTSKSEESFAPLTPPVLEVTEQDRGEGN